MQLSDYTLALLDDIEKRIDPETEEGLRIQWSDFWQGKSNELVFTPRRKRVSSAGIEIKNVHINDYIESLCEIEKLYGINLSQPHLNDMGKIFRTVSEKGKRIFGLRGARKLAEKFNVKRGMIQQRNYT